MELLVVKGKIVFPQLEVLYFIALLQILNLGNNPLHRKVGPVSLVKGVVITWLAGFVGRWYNWWYNIK